MDLDSALCFDIEVECDAGLLGHYAEDVPDYWPRRIKRGRMHVQRIPVTVFLECGDRYLEVQFQGNRTVAELVLSPELDLREKLDAVFDYAEGVLSTQTDPDERTFVVASQSGACPMSFGDIDRDIDSLVDRYRIPPMSPNP